MTHCQQQEKANVGLFRFNSSHVQVRGTQQMPWSSSGIQLCGQDTWGRERPQPKSRERQWQQTTFLRGLQLSWQPAGQPCATCSHRSEDSDRRNERIASAASEGCNSSGEAQSHGMRGGRKHALSVLSCIPPFRHFLV